MKNAAAFLFIALLGSHAVSALAEDYRPASVIILGKARISSQFELAKLRTEATDTALADALKKCGEKKGVVEHDFFNTPKKVGATNCTVTATTTGRSGDHGVEMTCASEAAIICQIKDKLTLGDTDPSAN